GATVTPSFARSPWIRRCPRSGFSFARRTTRRPTPRTVGGRPGLRRLLVSYLLPASLRCQARSVACGEASGILSRTAGCWARRRYCAPHGGVQRHLRRDDLLEIARQQVLLAVNQKPVGLGGRARRLVAGAW